MKNSIVIITTCSNTEEAERLAHSLVWQKLAACVQFDMINSVYTWNNEIQQDKEVRLMIKTTSASYSAIEVLIQEHHTYELPEIIALPVTAGSVDYLRWIEEQTVQ